MLNREEIKRLVDYLNENPMHWEEFIKVLSETDGSILISFFNSNMSASPCGIAGRGDILVEMMIGLFRSIINLSPEMANAAFEGMNHLYENMQKQKFSKSIPVVITPNEYKS